MKKNLRIVSAAAAALLAVAPVAAAGVSSVSASSIEFVGSSNSSLLPEVNDHTVNFGINFNAIGAYGNVPSSVSATAEVTINGQKTTINLPENQKSYIYNATTNESVDASKLVAGQKYYTVINNASLNLGSACRSL